MATSALYGCLISVTELSTLSSLSAGMGVGGQSRAWLSRRGGRGVAEEEAAAANTMR